MGITESAGRRHTDRRPLYGLRRTHAARDGELVGSACVYESREPNPGGLLVARVEAAGGNNVSQLLIITLLLDATGEARRGIARARRASPIPSSSLIHGD
jgi:hypothetical protein